MRYAIISLGRPTSEIEALARQWGGREIRVAPLLGQVFCDLEPERAALLAREPGIAVREVKEHTAHQVQAPVMAAQYSLTDLFQRAHNLASPPLTGLGSTIAVLDSGVNKEHKVLKDKVVYEANFSPSLLVGDQFDHGTAVAYLAAGGKPGDAVVGAAPGAYIVSLKVMGDDGRGSDESVALGLEEVIKLHNTYPQGSPLRANIVNLSLGSPDTGDPYDPVRVAARKCAEKEIAVVAAAGNQGPAPETIGSPACDPQVIAVGALTIDPYGIWEKSSRGPTREGAVKPDLVFYGVNLLVASAKGPDMWVGKTGSSFSSPAISGGFSIINEIMTRYAGRPILLSEFWSFLPFITLKPQGVSMGKDNAYGYGMPWGDLIAQFARGAPGGLPDISSIIGLAFFGMFTTGMVKAMRRK